MARKKQDLSGILGGVKNPLYEKTEPAGMSELRSSDLEKGNISSQGVGLRGGELEALDAIALQYDISKNGLMRLALRLFLLDVIAGRLDVGRYVVPENPKKRRIVYPF